MVVPCRSLGGQRCDGQSLYRRLLFLQLVSARSYGPLARRTRPVVASGRRQVPCFPGGLQLGESTCYRASIHFRTATLFWMLMQQTATLPILGWSVVILVFFSFTNHWPWPSSICWLCSLSSLLLARAQYSRFFLPSSPSPLILTLPFAHLSTLTPTFAPDCSFVCSIVHAHNRSLTFVTRLATTFAPVDPRSLFSTADDSHARCHA